MNDTLLLTIAASLVATLFGVLIAILGWMGNKVYVKLDEMARTMHTIAGDLHTRISGIDIRLVRVETKVDVLEVDK